MPTTTQPRGPSRRGLILFLVIAFGWSWAIAAAIWRFNALADPRLATPVLFAYMAGPMFGALAATSLYDRGRRLDALALRPRWNVWLLWAWLIPLVLVAASILLSGLAPGSAFADPAERLAVLIRKQGLDPATIPIPMATLAAIQFAMAVTLGPLINTVGTLTEELGWRGWLWDRWRPLGLWRCNLLIGLVWGVWHAPIIAMGFNYPGMPVSGPLLMTVFTVLVAPLIGLVRERGGSVWHAGLFHGTLNAAGGLALLVLSPGTFPWSGLTGLAGFAVLAAAGALAMAAGGRKTAQPAARSS